MRKMSVLLSIFLILLVFFASVSSAGLINYERRNRYLRQGTREQAGEPALEEEAEEALPKWMKVIPRVRNRYEKKYDVNRDGKLQTAEVKIYLRDVIEIIEKKGGFTINSDILKEYDKNSDGVISRFEMKEILRDAGY